MDCEFPLLWVCDKLSAPNFRLGAIGRVDCVLPIKLEYFKRWYAIVRWVSGWVGVKLKISRKVYHIPTQGKFTIVMRLWRGGRAANRAYNCESSYVLMRMVRHASLAMPIAIVP